MSGLYTTEEHLSWALRHPDKCEFHVNKTFSVIAPTISFVLPTIVMVYSYIRSEQRLVTEITQECCSCYSRVYLETRRLQRRPLVTKCSLNLFVEHFPPSEGEDTGDPDMIFVTSSDIQPIQQISEKKTEASAANKLFLVMAGFLICWLPYFLWLPFSTLLVNIFFYHHFRKNKKNVIFHLEKKLKINKSIPFPKQILSIEPWMIRTLKIWTFLPL